MNNYTYGYHGANAGMQMAPHFGVMGTIFFFLAAFIVIVWSFYWKGRALWTAARHGQLGWFVVLLIVNTLGILEIIYIYFFACDCEKKHDHLRTHANHVGHDHTPQA